MKLKLIALCLSVFAGSSAFAVPNRVVMNAVDFLIGMNQAHEVEACPRGRAQRVCLARHSKSFAQGDFWVVRFNSEHACAYDVFVDNHTFEVSDALSSMSWGCVHTDAYAREGIVSPSDEVPGRRP